MNYITVRFNYKQIFFLLLLIVLSFRSVVPWVTSANQLIIFIIVCYHLSFFLSQESVFILGIKRFENIVIKAFRNSRLRTCV